MCLAAREHYDDVLSVPNLPLNEEAATQMPSFVAAYDKLIALLTSTEDGESKRNNDD